MSRSLIEHGSRSYKVDFSLQLPHNRLLATLLEEEIVKRVSSVKYKRQREKIFLTSCFSNNWAFNMYGESFSIKTLQKFWLKIVWITSKFVFHRCYPSFWESDLTYTVRSWGTETSAPQKMDGPKKHFFLVFLLDSNQQCCITWNPTCNLMLWLVLVWW